MADGTAAPHRPIPEVEARYAAHVQIRVICWCLHVPAVDRMGGALSGRAAVHG
jgi:hypothetical protein